MVELKAIMNYELKSSLEQFSLENLDKERSLESLELSLEKII